MSPTRPHTQRGVTLLEVMVAMTVLVMAATMIWAAFDQTGRIRSTLTARQETDHLARVAMQRITRDLRGAYLSLHVNQQQTLASIRTAFIAGSLNGSSTLALTTFTHRRLRRGTHEGDACEVGYRVETHRAEGGSPGEGYDLLRRESPRLDPDPERGGAIDVLIPGIRQFELRFWDDAQERWIETWDTQQATGQSGRLPSRVRITLTMREGERGPERVYRSATSLSMTRPLTFGLPIY
jgi:prepilin-type N-terminal cleavage/methylation domain-containing protein